jgi:hypothetical protein
MFSNKISFFLLTILTNKTLSFNKFWILHTIIMKPMLTKFTLNIWQVRVDRILAIALFCPLRWIRVKLIYFIIIDSPTKMNVISCILQMLIFWIFNDITFSHNWFNQNIVKLAWRKYFGYWEMLKIFLKFCR